MPFWRRVGLRLAPFWYEPFPLLSKGIRPELPAAVKGAPVFGAATRILDSEDRSEKMGRQEKAGRRSGERWSRQNGSHPDRP